MANCTYTFVGGTSIKGIPALKAFLLEGGLDTYLPERAMEMQGPSASARQTDTPAFKKWFGDSEVVDENGKPMVVYHGTARTGITKFSGYLGVAGHFAFNPKKAGDYADDRYTSAQDTGTDEEYGDGAVIYPVYLSAKKIFDARNPSHAKIIGESIEDAQDYAVLERNLDVIKAAGFDAYYDFDGRKGGPDGIAVFEPTQIKSAIGNTGAFDPENPDIRFSARAQPLTPADVLKPETIAKAEAAIAQYKKAEPPDPLTIKERALGEQLLEPMFEAARRNKAEFDATLDRIGESVNGYAKKPAIKKSYRAVTKLVLEGFWKTEEIKDLLRGTIVVNSLEDVQDVIDEIGEVYGFNRIKNRLLISVTNAKGETVEGKPLSTGYQDVLTNVVLPDGTIAEIQISTPEMVAAKSLGHQIFSFEREMPESPVKSRMVEIQKQIYAEGLGAYEGRAANALKTLSNSALSTGSAFSRTSEGLRGSGSGPQAVAERQSGETVTGTEFQSKNMVPGGKDLKSNFIRTSDPIIPESRAYARKLDSYISSRNKSLDLVSSQSIQNQDIKAATEAIKAALLGLENGSKEVMPVPIGRIPHVLSMLRQPTQMLKIDTSVIKKVFLEKHADEFNNITPRQLILAIYQPAMVLKSKTAGEYEIVTSIITPKGPVIVPVKVDSISRESAVKSTAIQSIYGRKVSLGGDSILQRLKDGALVYADPAQAQVAITGRGSVRLIGINDEEAQFSYSPPTKGQDSSLADFVKPLNPYFVGWSQARNIVFDGIANKKVKSDVDLMKWIGNNFKGETDAPSFSRREQKNAAASRVEGTSEDRFKRTPALQQAVVDLQEGKITRDEYNQMVDELRPVYPYKELPAITTPKDARYALANGRGQSPEKAAKYGVPTMTLTKGSFAQLRLDIPSYQEHNAWVVSVHTPKSTNREVQAAYDAGPVVGYESVAALTDVTFGMNQKAAAKIAAGSSKGTIATMLGKWSPISKADAKARAEAAMKDKSWTQVGMDPFRHSYFYDRDSMRPVLSADEVIQIGPLVLAKNVQFGEDTDITGAQIAFSAKQPVGKETEGWVLSRDETGRFRFGAGAKAYRLVANVASNVLDKVGMKPVSPELSRALRKMKVEVEKAQNLTVDVAKNLKDLPEQERQMISDVIEGELKRGVKPPKRVLELAASMQTIMSEQTAELVRLGMLTPEAAGRWDGKYLPRFYESKIGDETKAWLKAAKSLLGRTRTMQGITGNSLKARGMFENVPVADVQDWIAEGWEKRDEAFDPAVDTEVTMWRDYTRDERDDMGEIRDAMFRFVMGYNKSQRDLALGRLYENLAATQASRTEQPGYVKVPSTTIEDTAYVRRYGKLAGKWVPKEVMDQLSEFDNSTQNELLKMYLKGLSMWKEGKTVLNPVSHANNVLSNLTMAHFAGVSYWDMHKYAGAVRDLVKNDPMVEEAKEVGLFGGTFNQSELMEQLPEQLKAMAQITESTATKAVDRTWSALSYFLRKPAGKAYQAEDLFFRYLIYRDARKSGLNPDDSVDYAQQFIFTYDDLPAGARLIRNTAVPFFSYTYKAVPALARTLLEHPLRYAAPAAALYTVNAFMYAVAASLGGGEGEDWWSVIRRYITDSEFRDKARAMEKQERENLPPWMKGASATLATPKTIRLGMDDVTNLPLFLDISRIFPGGDLLDASANAGGIPLLQPLNPSNPVLNTIGAMIWNKDAFFGKDIVDKNDTSAEAAEKRGKWLWQQFTPAIAVGNYHWDRALNVIANVAGQPVLGYTGIGKDGLPVQPGYAAMQTVGIKIRPIDLDLSAQISKSQQNKLIRDLDAEISQIKRLEKKGAITSESADRQIELQKTKKERLKQGLTVEGEERK